MARAISKNQVSDPGPFGPLVPFRMAAKRKIGLLVGSIGDGRMADRVLQFVQKRVAKGNDVVVFGLFVCLSLVFQAASKPIVIV